MTPAPLGRRSLLLAGVSCLAGVGGLCGLTGCTLQPDYDHTGPDVPRAAPLPKPARLAWVFSSGGPRGFVHVGVIKALEELGLKPDVIVGASAGALVGALYASGLRAREIEALALDMQAMSLLRLSLGAQEHLSGTALAELVRKHSRVSLLEQMPIPMACVVKRRSDGGATAFTAGDVGLAVQASSAIEGQLTPVRIQGEQYVDADWVTPLPVRLAKALGAQKVLAVDATIHMDRIPAGTERYRESDVRKNVLVETDAAKADLLIKPYFGYWVSLTREFRERAIAAGYQETLQKAAALRALHAA